jgi:hypothetical protein
MISLVVIGMDGQVIVSDTVSREILFRFQESGINSSYAIGLAWATPFKGIRRLIAGYRNGNIIVWPLDESVQPIKLSIYDSGIFDICFDLVTNRLLIAFDRACAVIAFSSHTGDTLHGFGVFELDNDVGGLALLSGGLLLASVPQDKKLQVAHLPLVFSS